MLKLVYYSYLLVRVDLGFDVRIGFWGFDIGFYYGGYWGGFEVGLGY